MDNRGRLSSGMSNERKELEASWARTRTFLESAFAQLSASPTDGGEWAAASRYREWLDHNELELALDELEMLGNEDCAGAPFWRCLLQAATEMGLTEHTLLYQGKLADQPLGSEGSKPNQ